MLGRHSTNQLHSAKMSCHSLDHLHASGTWSYPVLPINAASSLGYFTWQVLYPSSPGLCVTLSTCPGTLDYSLQSGHLLYNLNAISVTMGDVKCLPFFLFSFINILIYICVHVCLCVHALKFSRKCLSPLSHLAGPGSTWLCGWVCFLFPYTSLRKGPAAQAFIASQMGCHCTARLSLIPSLLPHPHTWLLSSKLTVLRSQLSSLYG